MKSNIKGLNEAPFVVGNDASGAYNEEFTKHAVRPIPNVVKIQVYGPDCYGYPHYKELRSLPTELRDISPDEWANFWVQISAHQDRNCSNMVLFSINALLSFALFGYGSSGLNNEDYYGEDPSDSNIIVHSIALALGIICGIISCAIVIVLQTRHLDDLRKTCDNAQFTNHIVTFAVEQSTRLGDDVNVGLVAFERRSVLDVSKGLL